MPAECAWLIPAIIHYIATTPSSACVIEKVVAAYSDPGHEKVQKRPHSIARVVSQASNKAEVRNTCCKPRELLWNKLCKLRWFLSGSSV